MEPQVNPTHTSSSIVSDRARERRNTSTLHTIASKIPTAWMSKLGPLVSPLYHNLTLKERIEILLCATVIVFTAFPWVSLKDVIITGWNSFLYPIAFFMTISALFNIIYSMLYASHVELPKWLPEKSSLSLVVGAEIAQLGVITYIMLHRYSISFSATSIHDISVLPLLISVLGAIIFFLGISQKTALLKKKTPTIVHPTAPHEEDHDTSLDLDHILEQRTHQEEQQ